MERRQRPVRVPVMPPKKIGVDPAAAQQESVPEGSTLRCTAATIDPGAQLARSPSAEVALQMTISREDARTLIQ